MASNVLVIIPARVGSKGIPGKNFRPITEHGDNPVDLAVTCALNLRYTPQIVISTDAAIPPVGIFNGVQVIHRPKNMALDTTLMSTVVGHVLGEIPGPPHQIVVLLQPTQPLRKVKYVDRAIHWIESGQADAVVSLTLAESRLFVVESISQKVMSFTSPISDRRQDAPVLYKRDGTVYAVLRKNGWKKGQSYGVM